MKAYDITGRKFGKLTVISRVENYVSPKGQVQARWLCKCECGKECIKTYGKLRSRKNIACGCMMGKTREYDTGKKHLNWTGHEEILGGIWCRIDNSAKRRGRRLTITIKEAWDLFVHQNRKCALSGMLLSFAKNTKEIREGKNKASLDRIDPSGDYTKDNVQWVHPDINYMKQDYSQDYYIKMCKKVSEHTKKR